jgi:transcriptional regulator with XRE-family HTH domain
MSAKVETFGEYLKRLRGKTPQGKLAAAIGKTTMYISNIENGKNNPPDEVQLEKIADVLSLDEQMRFELIDKAAAERGTVARDLVMALAKNKSLRQFIRSPCAKVHTKKIDGTTVEFSCSYVGPTADFEDFLIERLGKDLPAGTAIPKTTKIDLSTLELTFN